MDGKEKPTEEQLNALLVSLYDEYFDYLREYAQNCGFSPEVAEDLVQETFSVAVQKAEALYHAFSHKGWLIRTLRNKASNHQRNIMYAQRLQKKLEYQFQEKRPDTLSPAFLYEGIIDQKDLDILIRYWANSEPVKSIAESLGLSEETCRKRIYRARDRFRKALEKENEEKD